MDSVRIGINGAGRIGRLALRAAVMNHENVNILGINDLADVNIVAHLLKYDSTHGKFPGDIQVKVDAVTPKLVVNGKEISIFSEKDPAKLPWRGVGVDIVLESTGFFTDKESAAKHLSAGAKKVVISAPPDDDLPTIVLGVNEEILKKTDTIVSNASCTTNCLAPMVKVLNGAFGLERGFMTTVHSYTSDQRLLDAPHKDLRRARSSALSMIPTSTGAARAVGKVIPELNGKLDGMAVRVPTPDGSFTDLVALVNSPVTVETVNGVFKQAASNALKGILEYTDDPIVSTDIIGNPHSCIFDARLTKVMGNMVKVCGWYDNEWAYANRCIELLKKMS